MKLQLPDNILVFFSHYKYPLAFIIIGLIYFCNLFVDIMNVDAVQYASISREMMESGSFLEVFHRGRDYLDKPPMLFWLSSLSMKVFGVYNFAYKLPSVLILIGGIYSTYRLAKLYYPDETAKVAALIVATTQGFLLMSNDVRTDGILTGFVMFSVWQLALYLKTQNWKPLLWASLGVAAAMMSKGPLGLIIPGSAVAIHLLMHRNWKQVFDPRWLVFLLLVFVCLLPMSYGLYSQFDLHPEKFVYGLQGPSGVRFFYWTQSFGRITGEISWSNNLGYFFFFHSILADIFPWTFLLIIGLGYTIWKVILQRFCAKEGQEFLTLGAFLLPFIALSMSNYKLPHYIFPLFPFLAIMMSHALFQLGEYKQFKRAIWFQHLLALVMTLIAPAFFVYVFGNEHPLWWLYAWLFPIVYIFLLKQLSFVRERFLWNTVLMACYFGSITGLYFYPNLLKYQIGTEVGRMAYESDKTPNQFYKYCSEDLSLDFYSQSIVKYLNPEETNTHESGNWIYTNEQGLAELTERGLSFTIRNEYDRFPVSRLNATFLNAKTREKTLKKHYVLELN